MAVHQNPIWESFLKPIAKLVIDEDKLRQLYKQIDWQGMKELISQPDLIYPEYYLKGNFHGIEGGYLNPEAAISYDEITQYVLPPNESWVRQGAMDIIGGQPRRILDLGCGTGSTTIILKQRFLEADVIGLDLSPYMLIMAKYKAEQLGLNIQWQHGNAQKTNFKEASFDLVTASLLFHETPPEISRLILRECFRLTKPGGQVIVLDGNQKTLRHTEWLTNIFEEPYIKAYAAGSLDDWMGSAGYEAVETEDLWWVHQVTRGIKPLPGRTTQVNSTPGDNIDTSEIPAIVF
jgi:ubiquinone/menaquinone biosynthesis C-methylase UbiE